MVVNEIEIGIDGRPDGGPLLGPGCVRVLDRLENAFPNRFEFKLLAARRV